MRLYMAALIMACSLAPSVLAQSPTVAPEQMALCKQGDGQDSIMACTAIIDAKLLQDAELSAVYYGRGMANDRLKRYGEALVDYAEAVDLNSDNDGAAYNLSVVCNLLDRALRSGGNTIGMPENAHPYMICGNSFSRRRQLETAMRFYDYGLSKTSGDPMILYNRGLTRQRMGDNEQALEDYTLSIAQHPTAAALINRGNVYSEKGDYAKAVADFAQAKVLGPEAFLAYANGCWARAKWGQELDQALGDCDKALELRPDNAGVLDSLCLVHFRLGRYTEAVSDCDAALKLYVGMAGSFYVRGLAKIRMGDADGGEDDIDRARRLNRNVIGEYAGYGVTR